ncbi:AsnC family transcriptional regulator [Streptomyces anulatus]|uniref:Lrp/AsnC family transcriptional regulator n=1 Tax=Streptomyces TaxID=1883 RepID=UPI0006DBC370|nr:MULTISPECIES: AsnC family transcriptional regulator [Streptomyces]KPL30917.1 AsnC family transcriptional regulator [Streptomyces anulatus]MBT1099691.1 Lrp/AsnC family transcriptional regulator [Streptomyces sp. Tu10]OKI83712.1 AsnC family transcriptional regulator [Streptomyces sp. TSRI0395]WSR76824.1 AsnC family transcriptional regulator [Streptomyces anulatus]WTC72106.1 AsnC family transcriptional regulator [Streptomyces anulatus]
MESVTLDALDRRLIHALQLDGRLPFSRIAAAVGVPERTVARRYHRLRSRLALRVVGLVDGRRTGMLDWVVRVRCAPEAVETLAVLLARREDTSWIAPLVGGTELTCMIRTPPPGDDGRRPFFEQLARTAGVREVGAACVLRPVAGVGGWAGRMDALGEAEQRLLLPPRPAPADPAEAVPVLSPADSALLRALSQDGRADLGRLASATGCSESTVRRRIGQLRDSGVLAFEVEIDPALFGYPIEALLWLDVPPAGLGAVAEALAGHQQVAFAALTTGPSSVFVMVECRSVSGLHAYVTDELAALHGITRIESAVTQRRTKRAGPLPVPLAEKRAGAPSGRAAAQ